MQHDGIFEFLSNVMGQQRIVRNNHANQESTEERVNPNSLRRQCSEKKRHANDNDRLSIRLGLRRVSPCKPLESRSHEKKDQRDETCCQAHGDERLAGPCSRHAYHESQQTLGRHIVRCSARQGNRTDAGRLHMTIRKDTSKHGECSDRHRHAHEQGEFGEWDAARREHRIKP